MSLRWLKESLWFRRIKRRRLRLAMRGYRILKKQNRLDVISRLKSDLASTHLGFERGPGGDAYWGAALGVAERVMSQYLVHRLCGVSLNLALLRAVTGESVAYPLPATWQRCIEQHGFALSRWRCTLMWWGCSGIMLARGGARLLMAVLQRRQAVAVDSGSAYLVGMTPGSVRVCNADEPLSFTEWYVDWAGKRDGIRRVCHSVEGAEAQQYKGYAIQPCSGPLPALKGVATRLRMLVWGLRVFAWTTVQWLTGRSWQAFFMDEAVLAAKARLLHEGQLAGEYLFPNSSWIYRPAWTYEAGAKGASIVFYYYSTNVEGFRNAAGETVLTYGVAPMMWPHYLAWDSHQAGFLQRVCLNARNAKIEVVGPIVFEGLPLSGEENFLGTTVAVFDVQPVRMSIYRSLAIPFEYYLPSVAKAFLADISKVCDELDLKLALKRKREIGSIAHRGYAALAAGIEKKNNVLAIAPSTSAVSLTKASAAVISAPFTSAALLGKAMGLPSVYYDPTRKIRSDDSAAHGVPVIRGLAELREWLSSVRRN